MLKFQSANTSTIRIKFEKLCGKYREVASVCSAASHTKVTLARD